MKKLIHIFAVLTLLALRCGAQAVYTPYSWTTIAGDLNSIYSYADGTNQDAAFNDPNGLAIDVGGNLYVADTLNNAIRFIVPAGTNWVVMTLAGQPGVSGYADGDPSTALFNNPIGVAVDSVGVVYVADTQNNAIRQIALDGTVSTLGGNPLLTNSTGFQLGGYQDGPGQSSLFNHPYGVAVDATGNLYVADSDNFVIRKMQLPVKGGDWMVSTLAGAGGIGTLNGTGTNASFSSLWGIAVDTAGNVYVADNQNSMIRKVTPAGVVTTLAGQDQFETQIQGLPLGNADGSGTNAQFNYPAGLTLDSAGNVYVADQYNSEIRKITPAGVVTTLGGTAKFNFFGNPVGGWFDGSGGTALFNYPSGIAVDRGGNVYVSEESNEDIRAGIRPPITPLRVSLAQAQVSAADGIDDPIALVTDPTALASAPPLGMGVVADGVTPVLFEIVGAPGSYSCDITLPHNASFTPLTDNLFVLKNGQWKNQQLFSIPGPGSIGTNFIYLGGLEWTNFIIITNELEAVLSVTSFQSGISNGCSIKVRPPPVALVHGYNANGSSWSSAFKNFLEITRSQDFITPISYGTTTNKDGSINQTINITGRLAALVPVLDETLRGLVEAPLSTNWAFTRYDVVCHSQGGVLTRMLCQDVWSQTPVVAAENFFRGRFRRVVTIGSPHNGSLLLHYILGLENSLSTVNYAINRGLVLGNIAQAKFDPFGDQIALANDPQYPVDPRIKFHCVQTTITEGQPPSPQYNPLCYDTLGLCQAKYLFFGEQPGQILLPKGADGVVDLDSQGAGIGTSDTIITNTPAAPENIAHADKSLLFGVPPLHSQTSDFRVAAVVSGLLDGPASSFGPFVLPTLLSSDLKKRVDSLIPDIPPKPIIFPVLLAISLLRVDNNSATTSKADPWEEGSSSFRPFLPALASGNSNFLYQAPVPDGVPAGGDFSWFAIVEGTNGVSTNGVTSQPDTNDNSQVTLSVDGTLQGTILLYPTYYSTNGMMVIGDPVVVAERLPAATPTSIMVKPSELVLPVGGTLPLEIWGVYNDGTSWLLFVTPDEVTYTSSNTNAVTVDASGNIFQNNIGSSVVTVSFKGLTAQVTVSSTPVSIRKFAGTAVAGGFQLRYQATYGTTNVIEVSPDLTNWTPLTSFVTTNELVTYVGPAPTNSPSRFYRVKIP